MPDSKYCYHDSEVLKNKLNIKDAHELFEAEKNAVINLSHTTHQKMLEASILSFNKGDSSLLKEIFKTAVFEYNENDKSIKTNMLHILTSDDLTIGEKDKYDYYDYGEFSNSKKYDEIYKAKIDKMNKEGLGKVDSKTKKS